MKKNKTRLKGRVLFMCVGGYENRFIIGINHEACLAFVWLFYEFPFAVVHGDFVAVSSVRVVGADFCGEQKRFIAYLLPLCNDNHV